MRFHTQRTSPGQAAVVDPLCRPVVLWPGWATDYRMFDRLVRPSVRVIPLDPITSDFSSHLAGYVSSERLAPIELFGWSLGGSAALIFARAYPELVSRITLAGVRPEYPHAELDAARNALLLDRKRYLADFYRRCFLPGQRDDYRWFQKTLAADYLAAFSTDTLLRGLEFLARASFDAADLTRRPTAVVHGALDRVAPVDEIAALAGAAGIRPRIVPNSSHAVFMDAGAYGAWHD